MFRWLPGYDVAHCDSGAHGWEPLCDLQWCHSGILPSCSPPGPASSTSRQWDRLRDLACHYCIHKVRREPKKIQLSWELNWPPFPALTGHVIPHASLLLSSRPFGGPTNEVTIINQINAMAELLDSPGVCVNDSFIVAGYTNPAHSNRQNEIWFLERPWRVKG